MSHLKSGSEHVTPQILIAQRPQSVGSLGLQWLALSVMFLTSFSTSLPPALLASHTGFSDGPQTRQNYTSAPKSLPPNIHMAETFISHKSLLHSRLVNEPTPDLLKNRTSYPQDSQFPFTLPQFFFPHHFPPPSILYNL